MPEQWELILRLLLAAALAGLLGGERELTDQPAGFRTHILVGLGAALFAIISAYGFQSIISGSPEAQVRADLTRVASQIVVGIGFLGGGAILKYGGSIRGLTTAASLWVTAAVGTAVGLGALVLAAATAGITLLALAGLRPLRALLRRRAPEFDEYLIEAERSLDVAALVNEVVSSGRDVRQLRVSDDDRHRTIHVLVDSGRSSGDLLGPLSRLDHVRHVDWLR